MGACFWEWAGGGGVQLEFHQLELRYERLRVVRPEPERRLLASLAEVGQQVPIVVVKDEVSSQHIVIDGYKRIRCLRRLARDMVAASSWPEEEAEALIVTRLMQTAEAETALEQSWLLLELKQRFGFSREELARRFGHSVSWVSRRLALVQELPDVIQERVRRRDRRSRGSEISGAVGARQPASLSGAGRRDRIDPLDQLRSGHSLSRLSDRQLGDAPAPAGRPLVFLKSHKQAQAAPALVEPSLGDSLLGDLEFLSSAARRADRRLRQGVLRNVSDPQRQELARCLDQSLHETERLAERFHQEMGDVRPEHAGRDSEAPATGA